MGHGESKPMILVIDDEPDIVKMLAKQLEHWGYRVATAASGEDGLALVKTERVDLVLLDIVMPKMKGREVCALLKADPNTRDIPVIFLTALGLADHVRVGLELGGEDYVVKPFDPPDLKARIEVCLSRHEEGRMRHQQEP